MSIKANVCVLIVSLIGFCTVVGTLADAGMKGNLVASVKKEKEVRDALPKSMVQDSYGKLPLSFIQNDGQIDEKVRYYEKGRGHSTYFTDEGVYLELMSGEPKSEVRGQRSEVHSEIDDSFHMVNSEPANSAGKKAENGSQKSEAGSKKQEIVPDTVVPPYGAGNPKSLAQTAPGQAEIPTLKSEIIKLVPLNANKDTEIVAEDMQEGKVNYFIGNDPEKWKTNIPTYQSVKYENIYKDIDMKFYGNNRQMEYDIILRPGADLSQVQLSYEGVEDMSITEDGDLEIALKACPEQGGGNCNIIQKKPYCYQEIEGKKVEVEGSFKLLNTEPACPRPNDAVGQAATPGPDRRAPACRTGRDRTPAKTKSLLGQARAGRNSKQFVYTFEVASYDKNHPLFIDPVLVYSTYLGGSGDDLGQGIAVDSSRNAYITGYTTSTDFPTASPLQGSNVGGEDAFITKIDASGTSLIYSTYLGGSGDDGSHKIAVDTSGNAYITGWTASTDFPTASPIQGSFGGGIWDAFITKIDASGSSLVYSTYLGGSDYEVGSAPAVDTSGNVYIVGYTTSTDFPTASPLQGSYIGGVSFGDAFITKIDASGTSLIYSTYLGGSGDDFVRDIAVDASGNAYITGQTASTDFPTASPIQGSFGGIGPNSIGDAFITKIDASGSSLVYSTYLGGSLDEYATCIAVDASGNAYVSGWIHSIDFPTASPLQGSHGGSWWDAFITKIDASGTSLVYSTYWGG